MKKYKNLFLLVACNLLLPQVALSNDVNTKELDKYLETIDASAIKVPITCEVNQDKLSTPTESKVDSNLLKLLTDHVAKGYFLLQIKDSKGDCQIVTANKKLPSDLTNHPMAKQALAQMSGVMNGILCKAVFPTLNFNFSQFKDIKSTKSENEYVFEQDRNTLKVNMEKNKISLVQMAPDKESSKFTDIEYKKDGTVIRPKSFTVKTSKHSETISGTMEFGASGALSIVQANVTVKTVTVSRAYILKNCK